ncbi:MAG: hydroxyphenylacetyl-CoA thioesterase PaaI [Nocardioides sp.]|uniref:hydroxyphenylacetyl-CoA thioesterase PaaI n=1 Tax=Nocardioides sp. TaxID=35761 RepID=UPI0039E5EFE1
MSDPVGASGRSAEEVARLSTESMLAADAATRMLGIELREVGPGLAVAAMTVRADMLNGWQSVHGGLIASLADTAFAVACNSRGQVTVASGFDVDFIEPARLGDVLVATATETALRGRSGIYDIRVTRESDGTTIAEFRGRSRSVGTINPAVG